MPYITEERKSELQKSINSILSEPLSIGDVNYIITMIVQKYIYNLGINYSVLNEVIGVLECAKLELYRRLVSVYEDNKIKENGDVYY